MTKVYIKLIVVNGVFSIKFVTSHRENAFAGVFFDEIISLI
jgi:hypothetical protein